MWGVMSDSEDFPNENRGLTPRVFERLFARIDEVCECFHFIAVSLRENLNLDAFSKYSVGTFRKRGLVLTSSSCTSVGAPSWR